MFVTLLGQLVGGSELLAALLVFRVLYYLAPFLVAIVAYAYLESTARSVRGITESENVPRTFPGKVGAPGRR